MAEAAWARGMVAEVDASPLARNSIEVFHLKGEDLRVDRQKAQEEFRDKYFDAMRKFNSEKPGKSAAQRFAERHLSVHVLLAGTGEVSLFHCNQIRGTSDGEILTKVRLRDNGIFVGKKYRD